MMDNEEKYIMTKYYAILWGFRKIKVLNGNNIPFLYMDTCGGYRCFFPTMIVQMDVYRGTQL